MVDKVDISIFILVFFVGIIIGISFMGNYMQPNINELGGAICKEQFKGTFQSYSDKVLTCNPPQKIVSYDGIQVLINQTR